jgi:hypothetical protein
VAMRILPVSAGRFFEYALSEQWTRLSLGLLRWPASRCSYD